MSVGIVATESKSYDIGDVVNLLAKLFSNKRKLNFKFNIGRVPLTSSENGVLIVSATGGGMGQKHGDGMTITSMRSMGAGRGVCFDEKSDVVGLSSVRNAQIIHDIRGEWVDGLYPKEANSNQSTKWSVFNKEASCQ